MKNEKKCIRKSKLKILKNDEWLQPFSDAIEGRHSHVLHKLGELTGGKKTLSEFADGHLYYGLHLVGRRWVFREWAPNATAIYLIGDFNGWQESEEYKLKCINDNGDWEIKLPLKAMRHTDLYKMKVYWKGGQGERIPAWCCRVVQDEDTKIFSAQVWNPETPYV